MSKRKELLQKAVNETPHIEHKAMSVIKDGNQYSIRIPKEFAETLKSTIENLEELKFVFSLTIPPTDSKNKPTLTGMLVHER